MILYIFKIEKYMIYLKSNIMGICNSSEKDYYKDFISCCINGNIKKNNKLLVLSKQSYYPKKLYYQNEKGFVVSCLCGKLEVVKLVWNLPIENDFQINIYANNVQAFISSCFNGYLDVAQ